MKYVFNVVLNVDWLKMSNESLVVDEIDDHSTQENELQNYSYEFIFGVMFCLKIRDSCLVLTPRMQK